MMVLETRILLRARMVDVLFKLVPVSSNKKEKSRLFDGSLC